jgi:hypothetical protein
MDGAMVLNWDRLPDDEQLTLAQEALSKASGRIAIQAEVLADEIECGNIADRGGPDALRLLAAVLRSGDLEPLVAAGLA